MYNLLCNFRWPVEWHISTLQTTLLPAVLTIYEIYIGISRYCSRLSPDGLQWMAVLSLSITVYVSSWNKTQTLLIFRAVWRYNTTQMTQHIISVLVWRRASVADGGPTSNQHRDNVLWLLGHEAVLKAALIFVTRRHVIPLNPLTSRPGCMPGSRYTGVRVLFFVIWSWNC